jgi:ABC-type nitrate/sulfonate/bicarbonate transport system substrate-binding protein
MHRSSIGRRITIAALASLLPAAVLAQTASNDKLVDVTLVSSTANPPSVSNIYYLAALDRTFRKHGFNVQLQQSSGSPSSLAAIVSGKAEFASINLTTLANAAAEGVKARIIATGNFDFPGVILSQPEIKSIKDLEGKKMGATAIGSMDYTIPQAYLVNAGVDFSKITWAATRQASVTIQALSAHQIDAAWINVSEAVKALAVDPKLKVLVEAAAISKVAPNPGGTVVVTDKYASEHPDVIQNFVDAVIEANRALYQDKSFFDSVVEHWLPGIYSADQKQFLYTAYQPSWGVNGGLAMNVMRSAIEAWKTSINPGRAKNPYFSKAEDLVDTRFAGVTLGKLGKLDGTLDEAEWLH